MFQSIEELKQAWEADSKIDIRNLGVESIKSPSIHSKYLSEYIDAKKRIIKTQSDYNILVGKKVRYWRGEMSPEEVAELGWNQWQYNKIAMGQIDQMVDADEELSVMSSKLNYWKLYADAAERILTSVKQRDFSISNAIKFILHMNGEQV